MDKKAKEMALKLIQDFKELYDYGNHAIDCALITVNHIIESHEFNEHIDYWHDVKFEIQNYEHEI